MTRIRRPDVGLFPIFIHKPDVDGRPSAMTWRSLLVGWRDPPANRTSESRVVTIGKGFLRAPPNEIIYPLLALNWAPGLDDSETVRCRNEEAGRMDHFGHGFTDVRNYLRPGDSHHGSVIAKVDQLFSVLKFGNLVKRPNRLWPPLCTIPPWTQRDLSGGTTGLNPLLERLGSLNANAGTNTTSAA